MQPNASVLKYNSSRQNSIISVLDAVSEHDMFVYLTSYFFVQLPLLELVNEMAIYDCGRFVALR